VRGEERIVKRVLFLAAVVAALLPGGTSMALAQTEVSLLVPNPFRRTLDKVAGGFEPKTGYKLNITLGRGMGTRQQIARGEMFDVSILLPPYPDALASGNVDPNSATVLAKLVLAVGVKKGAAKPDVFSAEALRRTLLAARTIAIVDPNIGSDGAATRDALQKLGVLDQISAKTKIAATAGAVAELVGQDEAEICIFYRNEMGVNPNVDVVGTLPVEFAPPTDVVAFISTHARDAVAAKALVDHLASPESEAVYEKDGLVPVP
jgi:molybdate transport system substrate-binding protein